MGFLDYKVRPRVLVVGNGHAYDRTALMGMIESFDGMEGFLVEHPLAERVLNPEALSDVDAVVLYDMPGGNPWAGPAMNGSLQRRSGKVSAGCFRRACQSWHCITRLQPGPVGASMPMRWGACFCIFPEPFEGRQVMDGGTRADMPMTITAEDANHPLFAGLPTSFTLTDEAYLMKCSKTLSPPLPRTDVALTDRNLYSLKLAMTGERRSNRDWHRPAGSISLSGRIEPPTVRWCTFSLATTRTRWG